MALTFGFIKKISPIIIVGFFITIACFILYIWGPPFIQDVSNKAYDAFMKMTAEPPKSGKVVIVDIDDSTLNTPEFGQWPWPRYLVAELSQRIIDAGAAVVAYDIVFAEKDRTSPLLIQKKINDYFEIKSEFKGVPEEYQDFDRMFASVLQSGNTILGCFMISSKDNVKDIKVELSTPLMFIVKSEWIQDNDLRQKKLNEAAFQAGGIMSAIPELNQVTRNAFFNADQDSDGIVRNNPLFWICGDKIFPSLSLASVMVYQNLKQAIIWVSDSGVDRISLKKQNIPTDLHGRLVLNYRTLNTKAGSTGFSSSFPIYSAKDIFYGKVGTNELSDKIVFIGTSAVGLNDIKATPLTQFFSGVEVHATMVDNLLAGDILRNPSWMIFLNSAIIFIVGTFLTFFISKGRSWLSFIVSIIMVLAAMKISLIMLKSYQLVFVPVWLIITIMIVYPILTMLKFWEEELQKKKVRDMFGTMVSKDVLHYLENHPESFSLTGVKSEATMFFSDIAGFTTISETLSPHELSTLLNKYLSPMTQIIMDRRGYVDKYAGDGIMAEWGVPYAQEDHAKQACFAAIEQQEKIAEIRPVLKAEFGHDINVRMGLNSGHVTAGNMGSGQRMQYTVMGDAVNQAARLEPANKDYGTLIMISEATYESAKDVIEARLLDRIIVKGKTKPIHIYELLAKKGKLPENKQKVIDFYVTGLKLHWNRQWDEAIKHFNMALELDPGDIPSVNMRTRVEGYKINPPPDTWNGEYYREKKD